MADSLQVKLGADTSEFRGQLAQAANASKGAFDKVGESAARSGSTIDKIFGGLEHKIAGTRHLAGALATAFGLNIEHIAENVSRFILGFSEQYQESLKQTAELSEKVADANIANMRGVLGAEQKYKLALEEREKILKRIANDAPRGVAVDPSIQARFKSIPSFLGIPNPFTDNGKQLAGEVAANTNVDSQKEQIELAKTQSEINAHDLEIKKQNIELDKIIRGLGMERLTDAGKLRKTNADILGLVKDIANGKLVEANGEDSLSRLHSLEIERLKEKATIVKTIMLSASEQHEFDLLEAKGVERLTLAEKVRYEVLKLEVQAKKNLADIESLLAIPIKERTEVQKTHLSYLLSQVPVIQKKIDLENELLNKTKEVTNEEDKQKKIAVTRTGGELPKSSDFAGASDAALEEMVRRLNAELAKMSTNPGSAFNFGNSFGIAADTSLLNAVKEQQKFRTGLRDDNALGGESLARQNFQGNPLDFDRIFSQFTSSNDKLTGTIQSIDERLRMAGFGKPSGG